MSGRTVTASDPNVIKDWAGEMGEKWLANIDRLEAMIVPVGAALIERAAFQPGERVVDIGCGGGVTSLAAAARVGAAGSVLGLDISPDLVAAASRRAEARGVENLTFVKADAATTIPSAAPFDRLLSRFGIMFFTEPQAAFVNLRRMIGKGGRADFAVWATIRENPWRAEMMAVLGRHIELPVPVPGAPGPFALGETDYFREILGGAGFTAIDFEAWTGDLYVSGPGATPEDAVRFAQEFYLKDFLAEQTPNLQAAIAADLKELFRRYHRAEGVAMPGKVWLVTARG